MNEIRTELTHSAVVVGAGCIQPVHGGSDAGTHVA